MGTINSSSMLLKHVHETQASVSSKLVEKFSASLAKATVLHQSGGDACLAEREHHELEWAI